MSNYKVTNQNQQTAIMCELSCLLPNTPLGNLTRGLLFNDSITLDYSFVANTIVKHFPELDQLIYETLSKFE